MWEQLIFLVLAVVMGWFLYRQLKGNPQAFSGKNISRSLWTLGLLSLFLIAFIGFLVMLVRR